MRTAGLAGPPVEHLNPPNFAPYLTGLGRIRSRTMPPNLAVVRASRRSVRSALRRIASAHTLPDGTFTLKVMWHDLTEVLHRHDVDLDDVGAPITWVRIGREDRLRQAVSWVRAEQTGAWVRTMDELAAPTYDATRIADKLARIDEAEVGWDRYLTERGAAPLTITYEQLDADFATTMRRVFDHLGASGTPVPERPIERQADELNDDWLERFRAEQSRTMNGPEAGT
jgi:trehalose 2-sulfotransferase